MASGTRTEHPHIVVGGSPRGDQAMIKGTRIPVSLIAALFNRGETPEGILSLYPHISPSAVYDAISYYLDHKADVDREIDENRPGNVLAKLREDPELEEVSPGVFRGSKPFGSGA